MRPAHTPNMVNGSISRCVVFRLISDSYRAIIESFSSLTSRYSMSPLAKKSSNSMIPFDMRSI